MCDQIQWEVQKIIGRGVLNSERSYLVKWKGFPESQATWEPLRNLKHCKKCIQEYEKTHNPYIQTKKRGKKRRKSQKFNESTIKEENLSEKIQENHSKGQKIQEDTSLPRSEKENVQNAADKEVRETQIAQCQVETLEIFSPFFIAPQKQNKEAEVQSQITDKHNEKSVIKRIFSRVCNDNVDSILPSKKLKIQSCNSVNEAKSQLNHQEKELEKQQQERQQKDYQNPAQFFFNQKDQQKKYSQQAIDQENLKVQKNSSFKQNKEKDQESEIQKINTIQPQRSTKNPQNVQQYTINTKVYQKVTMNQFLHFRQIKCDGWLKIHNAVSLKAYLTQKTNHLNQRAPLIDLTDCPELLEEYGFLKPIKQAGVNMEDFEALIRTKYGWLAVGKVQGVGSIVGVEDLSLSAWNSLLQKYK